MYDENYMKELIQVYSQNMNNLMTRAWNQELRVEV